MDQKEVSKYPFISTYVQKKSQNLQKELIISVKNSSGKVENAEKPKSTSYPRMINLIRRVCPSLFSSSQASASELQNLILFLDTGFNIENIEKLPEQKDLASFENIKIDLHRINDINSLGAVLFSEIVRQVSIDSTARGYILNRVWNF